MEKIYKIAGYIFCGIGILLMLDGIFFIPFSITKYGFTNIGLENARFFVIIGLLFIHKGKIEEIEKRLNDKL